MTFICYTDKQFGETALTIINQANRIIRQYQQQGFDLTLRQLYYQFIQADLLPASWADPATGSTNNERSYKKLGDLVSDGRMAGLIDWTAIVDRGRGSEGRPHWETPADIIQSAAASYGVDLRSTQQYRPEVWFEKDALSGVFEGVCRQLDVRYLACKGYLSKSEIWNSSQRLLNHAEDGQTPIILHFGDHDPSGKDMTRDIEDQLVHFFEYHGEEPPEVHRLALNMDQIRQYNPPPNPAKVTDSRAKGYIKTYGTSSWELDALNPTILADIVRAEVAKFTDDAAFDARLEEQRQGQESLKLAAVRWPAVEQFLRGA